MLSSISRLAGIVVIGFGVSAPTHADVVIPAEGQIVVPAPGPQHVVLRVCHPCTGCHYDVPVCLPACCEGAPRVCHQRTIIGCGRVVYEWCCGYRVVIRFTRHGGYRIVHG
jgi:hypothetical protein